MPKTLAPDGRSATREREGFLFDIPTPPLRGRPCIVDRRLLSNFSALHDAVSAALDYRRSGMETTRSLTLRSVVRLVPKANYAEATHVVPSVPTWYDAYINLLVRPTLFLDVECPVCIEAAKAHIGRRRSSGSHSHSQVRNAVDITVNAFRLRRFQDNNDHPIHILSVD